MIEIIGWSASLLFAFCGLPAVRQCYKDGHTNMSKAFIIMWFLGEILSQIYVLMKHGWDMPLLWNYWINTFFILIILRYMFFPRKDKL